MRGVKKEENSRNERKYITEADIIKKHHKFLRESSSNSSKSPSPSQNRSSRKIQKNSYQKYGEEMAKKYYSKLYKQYALVDLSRYETGQIGCRWRTEKEVLGEKSQKICGNVVCGESVFGVFQVNFGYVEDGVKKNALVKVSLCQQCSQKLNHKKTHKKLQPQSPTHPPPKKQPQQKPQ